MCPLKYGLIAHEALMKQIVALTTEDFEIAVGPCGTPSALRRRLQRMPEVQAVRAALDAQVFSDDDLKSFVSQLVTAFAYGTLFPYDLALAAIATVLEARPTPFATEYLSTLSRLRLQEMPISTRVARECLVQHSQLAVTLRKDLSVLPPHPAGEEKLILCGNGYPTVLSTGYAEFGR
jgi:hypothetical protein